MHLGLDFIFQRDKLLDVGNCCLIAFSAKLCKNETTASKTLDHNNIFTFGTHDITVLAATP
jgi:hypothetical protein